MAECKRCGHCCTYAKFNIPNDAEGKDKARWFQLHGCRTVNNDKLIWILIPQTCAYLAFNAQTKEYFCADYDNRPQICRDYMCKTLKEVKDEANAGRQKANYKEGNRG